MPTYLQQLQQVAQAIAPLPDAAWRNFAALWAPVAVKRKTVLTAAGETEKYLYFVGKGAQRLYYFDDHDREATLLFTYAPSFGGVLDSLLLQRPSRYFYETLTASELLRAPAADLRTLMAACQPVETLVRAGVTGALAGVLERLVEVQCFPAADRFRELLRRSPHLLHLIPHKYLANYLGMDATNFSKLLNNVRI